MVPGHMVAGGMEQQLCCSQLPKGKVPNPMLGPYDSSALMASRDIHGASLIAQLVKNPPVVQKTPVRFLCQEDPLEKR